MAIPLMGGDQYFFPDHVRDDVLRIAGSHCVSRVFGEGFGLAGPEQFACGGSVEVAFKQYIHVRDGVAGVAIESTNAVVISIVAAVCGGLEMPVSGFPTVGFVDVQNPYGNDTIEPGGKQFLGHFGRVHFCKIAAELIDARDSDKIMAPQFIPNVIFAQFSFLRIVAESHNEDP